MALRSPSCLLPLLLVFLVPAARVDAQSFSIPSLLESTCTNTANCTDQPDCTGCGVGELVPDPENCRGFYTCSDGEVNLQLECGTGQIFDPVTRACVPGNTCENCPEAPPTSKCSYDCSADGFMPSTSDCHSYYECTSTDDVTGSVTCEAPTPFFDGKDCQDDERLCCHCQPYCYTGDQYTFVADPQDCRSFYFCLEEGKVPTSHGTCDDGENFDALLQGCSASAPCSIQASCLNVLGADGCIDPFTCLSDGYFAKCPELCTPEYYHCTAATGDFQAVESCTGGTVFHPDTHNCVSPDSCPYEGGRKPAVATRTHWMFPAPKA